MSESPLWVEFKSLPAHRYNNSTVPFPLTQTSGLASNERAVGRYLGIDLSENVQNQTADIVSSALVQVYYKLSDLDKTGDGDLDDPEDINEATLTL